MSFMPSGKVSAASPWSFPGPHIPGVRRRRLHYPLGVGGLPFLLPLLYQIGMGLPAWQSGLLMMPTAAAAMGMKLVAPKVLGRYGFRQVLVVNTLMIGLTICLFSMVTPSSRLL